MFDRFHAHAWRYHYEVVVTRQGQAQVVARVPSRWAAERTMVQLVAQVELSAQSLQWRRQRGVHPDRVAQVCLVVCLAALAFPVASLQVIIGALCLAVMGGLLSSGRQWRHGGRDDR